MSKTKSPLQTNPIRKNLPALLIFLWMPLYGFIVVCRCRLAIVDGITYLFHCVDFSMGFCSRFLPGAVYNLFVKEPTQLSATVYEYILLFLFYIALALLLQKWYYRLPQRYRKDGAHLLFLYLTGTATFAAFIYQPGMLDVSWVYLSVIFILLMQNRYTRFALPLLMLPAVMVHFGVMICYVPFWALLLLYEIISAQDKKEKKIWTVIFFLTCFTALGSFFYFLVFNKKNITYDIQEFNAIIESRGSDRAFYFDYIFYADPENMDDFLKYSDALSRFSENPFTHLLIENSDSVFAAFVNAIYYQIQLHIYFYTQEDNTHVFVEPLIILLVLLPLLGLLYGLIKQRSRQDKGNRLAVFFHFCCRMMLPLAVFGSILISTDSVRWLIHGFLCLFTLTLYVIYKDPEKNMEYIGAYFNRFSPAVKTVWQLIYALVIFDPYV